MEPFVVQECEPSPTGLPRPLYKGLCPFTKYELETRPISILRQLSAHDPNSAKLREDHKIRSGLAKAKNR